MNSHIKFVSLCNIKPSLYEPFSVKMWWWQRVRDGSQLQYDYVKGHDYRGDGPWFRYVALDALHLDYQTFSGQMLTRNQFIVRFYKVIGTPFRKSIPIRLEEKGGKLFLRPRRRFIRFREIQYYEERLHVDI